MSNEKEVNMQEFNQLSGIKKVRYIQQITGEADHIKAVVFVLDASLYAMKKEFTHLQMSKHQKTTLRMVMQSLVMASDDLGELFWNNSEEKAKDLIAFKNSENGGNE